MDAAHDKTDKILSVLEQRIKDTYTRSQAEISESWRRYMDEVDVRVKKLHKAVSDAEDDEQRAKALAEYKRVVRNATLTNERYAAMVQETSERLSHVNEIALVCVNGELPKIYTLNYNETNNGIANAVNGYSFTLLDENTVRNLIESDETLLPLRHLDLAADMRWNTKKINAEVLQGIIQGESVADIASRFERITDMNSVSALRNARTAVTGAENKGRMDGYTQAKMLGVKLKKRWMSALDGRTRHTHRALNGQMRENDKPFEVDGYEIMYPGDPMAAPEMVYNCRCTTVAEVMGADELKTGEVKPVWAESMTDEEYSEWKGKRELTTGSRDNIMIAGALNPYGKSADKHAEQYYEFIRRIDTDVDKIVKHTGFDKAEILAIKKYLFIDSHDLGNCVRRFDADYMIAQSWQRLFLGKGIMKHDMTLLLHESFERSLVESGLSQNEAHIIASKKYNYQKEAEEYYAAIEKHKKGK